MGPGHQTCSKEGILGEHASTLKHISVMLDRFVNVAEKIAAQGEQLIELRRDNDILFTRIRALEMAPINDGSKVKHNIILAVATVVASYIVAFFSHK